MIANLGKILLNLKNTSLMYVNDMLRTMRLPSMITNCLNIFVSCLIRLVWLCSNYWKYTSEKTEDIGYIIDCPSFVYISFLRTRRSFHNVLLYLASLSHYSSDHVGVNIYFIILCIHWRGFSYIAMVKWSKLKFHSGGISLNVCINSVIFLTLRLPNLFFNFSPPCI